jgi:hypothetical protein
MKLSSDQLLSCQYLACRNLKQKLKILISTVSYDPYRWPFHQSTPIHYIPWGILGTQHFPDHAQHGLDFFERELSQWAMQVPTSLARIEFLTSVLNEH